MTAATSNAVGLTKKACTSMSMPMLIRKNGIKMALPTNSMRFIKGETPGISRLSTKPAKNAPNMPSKPTTSASNEAKNTMANTKIYCATLSPKRPRNHRANFGNTPNTTAHSNTTPTPKRSQYHTPEVPLRNATITAKMNNDAVTVTMVPATAMLTERLLATPILLTTG